MNHVGEVMGYLAIEGDGVVTAKTLSLNASLLSRFENYFSDLFNPDQ